MTMLNTRVRHSLSIIQTNIAKKVLKKIEKIKAQRAETSPQSKVKQSDFEVYNTK